MAHAGFVAQFGFPVLYLGVLKWELTRSFAGTEKEGLNGSMEDEARRKGEEEFEEWQVVEVDVADGRVKVKGGEGRGESWLKTTQVLKREEGSVTEEQLRAA
eukprot:1928901-Rhodomonas_salina.1